MVDVSVEVEKTLELSLQPDKLVELGDRLLELLGQPEAELSVLLCDDAQIQELNEQWRGKDAPTDVLSFPQQEALAPGQLAEASEGAVLGDVVISVETAARQADELGHSLELELAVLLVHGVLHLLGHDHEPPADPAAMRAEEVRLLGALGLDSAAALIARAS